MSRSAWGDRPARRRPPPPGWFVPAWNDDGSVNPAWTDGRDALLETARALGVYVVYCLFDEPARTDRAPYLPDGSPTGPGQSFPARHNTWNGRSPGRAVASDLLWGTYLAGLDPVAHPELILLDANEPPPNPGPGSWWTPADHAWMRRELADHGWGGHLLQIDVREDSLSDDAPDVKAEHFYPQNAENPNFPLLAQVQQGTGGGGPRVALSSSDGQFLWDIDKPNANAVKLADRGVCSTWMAVNPLHDLAPSELRVLRGIARALDL